MLPIIRNLIPGDTPSIAFLHLNYLDTTFPNSKYSLKLISYYYQTIFQSPENIALVADIDGLIAGYICLVVDINKVNLKMMRMFPLQIICNYTLLCLHKPKIIVELLLPKITNILFHCSSKIDNSIFLQSFSSPTFELRPIVVHPDYQGSPIAGLLLAKAENLLKEKGEKKYFLHVDESNTRAIRFYQKFGFEIFGRNGALFLMKKSLI